MIKERCYISQFFLIVFVCVLLWQNYLTHCKVEYLTEVIIRDNREMMKRMDLSTEYMIRKLHNHMVDTVHRK